MRLLWIGMLALPCLAQVNNRFFADSLRTIAPYELRFQLDNLGFWHNTEYFGPLVEGATLFGLQVLPRLHYQMSPKTSFSAGVFVRRDFGHPDFSQVEPFFRLEYNHKGFSAILGSLRGSLTHGLSEPIFDYRRVITHRMENGLQLLYHTQRLQADLWIDWRKMIYDRSPYQEEFHQGMVAVCKLVDGLALQGQSLLVHRGGQIQDTALKAPAETRLNASLGMNWHRQWGRNSVHIQGHALHYQASRTQGNGWLGFVGVAFGGWQINASYWCGYGFENPLGMPLYGSTPVGQPPKARYLAERKLVFLRLIRELSLGSGQAMAIRIVPYYDIGLDMLEYATEFYWRVYLDGLLKKDLRIVAE